MGKVIDKAALAPGTILREWRLDEVVGTDESGIVYKGRGVYFDEPVAIREYFPAAICTRDEDGRVAAVSPAMQPAYRSGLDGFVGLARSLWTRSAAQQAPGGIEISSTFEQRGTAYMVMNCEGGIAPSRLLEIGSADAAAPSPVNAPARASAAVAARAQAEPPAPADAPSGPAEPPPPKAKKGKRQALDPKRLEDEEEQAPPADTPSADTGSAAGSAAAPAQEPVPEPEPDPQPPVTPVAAAAPVTPAAKPRQRTVATAPAGRPRVGLVGGAVAAVGLLLAGGWYVSSAGDEAGSASGEAASASGVEIGAPLVDDGGNVVAPVEQVEAAIPGVDPVAPAALRPPARPGPGDTAARRDNPPAEAAPTVESPAPQPAPVADNGVKGQASALFPAKHRNFNAVVADARAVVGDVVEMGRGAEPSSDAPQAVRDGHRIRQANMQAARNYLSYLDTLEHSMRGERSEREVDENISNAQQARRYVQQLRESSRATRR